MLLGAATSGDGRPGQAGLSDAQRNEVLSQIKAIVEKPIEIKKETIIVSDSLAKDQQHILDRVSQSQVLQSSVRKMTYLEEYDQSKQKSLSKHKGDDNRMSSKYSDIVEEDIALRLGSSGKTSKKKDDNSDGSIDDLV